MLGQILSSAVVLASGALAIAEFGDHEVFARIVAAAAPATTDAGYSACVTAEAVFNNCYSSGYFASTVPASVQDACGCCYQGSPISNLYRTCASYIKTALPTDTTDYTTASAVYSICSAAGSPCAGGGGAATTAKPTTTGAASGGSSTITTAAGGGGAVPAACSSFISYITSCSSKIPGISTADAGQIASCLCFDNSGTFNTKFDDYGSSCAPYIKTADPTLYSDVIALETICEAIKPASTGTGTGTAKETTTTGTATGTTTTSSSPLGGNGATSTLTTTGASVTITKASSALAPRAVAPAGLVAWLANAATFVFGLFCLV